MANKLALTGVLIVAVWLLPLPARATVTSQQTAIPAYWGPDTADGMAIFHRLAQNRPTNGIVVINGSMSRPEVPFHPAWAAAIGRVSASGAKALVYVDTGYLGVDFGHGRHVTRAGGTSISEWVTQIKQDVDEWYATYPQIDGIFLDQTILLCGTGNEYADVYTTIRDYVRGKDPKAFIVINPGAPAERCYENVADTMLSFEGDAETYRTHIPPDWQRTHPDPKKFWHLIHNAPAESDMREVIARSKANNAGYVYATERTMTPFPWGGLASYWDAQLVAAAGIEDTTPPQTPVAATALARADDKAARVRLNWPTPDDDVAVSGYEIHINGAKAAETHDNAYQASGLTHATTYTFTIKARDAAGNLSAASAPLVVTTPAPGPAVTEPAACLSPEIAEYRVTFGATFGHHRVFIDSDNDPATGWHLPPGLPGGVDMLIENTFLYRYTGPGWLWQPVAGVTPLVSESAGTFVWRVPASGQSRQIVVFSGFTADDPPDEYSAPITVDQTQQC
jgi:hypothetical protein